MECNKSHEKIFEELNSKHRKERKELQSTIQSLKKSASKGDKKKRKEILEEIARLETALEKRQTDELNEFQNNKNSKQPQVEVQALLDGECDALMENFLENQPRLSKAQKRRNKKANEEKQREAEILAHAEEDKNGPRMVENRTVEDILRKRKLCLYPIQSDGNCLYNAIQHQLQLTGRGFLTVAQLRDQTANYILENKQKLIYYMTNSKTGDTLTDEDFIKYCENIRNTPAWGGQVEIKALSTTLRVPIEVLQASGPPTIQGAEYGSPNLVVTYHRLMYSLGEHYNATRPLEDYEHCENKVDEELFIPELHS